jgi:hypothetical protein
VAIAVVSAIKGSPQDSVQFARLPRAVRNNEIEQTTFFARFLLLKRPAAHCGSVRAAARFFEVGLIGGLVPLDLAQATVLLSAPLSRLALEESAATSGEN